jgi:hypothetical protein
MVSRLICQALSSAANAPALVSAERGPRTGIGAS